MFHGIFDNVNARIHSRVVSPVAHTSALCCYGEDDDGKVLKHSFNPLAKCFLLRDVTVPDVYKNI